MTNANNHIDVIISSSQHLKYFVFNYSKIIHIRRPAIKSVSLLVLLVFRAEIVRMWKNGIAVAVFITFILDHKVTSTPKSWATTILVKNCTVLSSLNERHFFLEFELQQERTARRITNVCTIFVSFPF